MASKARIKAALINQLKQKGVEIEYFTDLIDDYLWFFEQEKAMQQDIKKRGHTYTAKQRYQPPEERAVLLPQGG